MRKLSSSLFLVVFGSCVLEGHANQCKHPELSTDKILQIAKQEIERHGGRFDPNAKNYEYKITRDECEYLFMLTARPAKPGDFLVIRIDRNGKVLRFTPGA